MEAGKEQESGLLAGAFGSLSFIDGIIFQTLYWETVLNELNELAVKHTTWSNWALIDHWGPCMAPWSECGAIVFVILWIVVT